MLLFINVILFWNHVLYVHNISFQIFHQFLVFNLKKWVAHNSNAPIKYKLLCQHHKMSIVSIIMSIPSSETSAAVSIFPGIETQCLHGKTKKTPYQKKICPHNSFLSLFYSLTTDVSLVIFASAHFPP